MDAETVYESKNLKVFFQNFETELLVVTFNELGSVVRQDGFWGKEFFRKLGIASIGVMTQSPNWYPAKEMDQAIQSINIKTKGRRIVTYGHSQGGYGALKFSVALGATSAFAFCPQWSIRPEEVGHFDQRFTHFFNADLDNGGSIRPEEVTKNSFIFFDPYENVDLLHSDLINCPTTSRVIVPFTGHTTVRIMADTEAGADIFSCLKDNGIADRNFLRNIIRKYRGTSVSYQKSRYLSLLKALPKTRYLMLRHIQLSEGQRALIDLVCEIKAGKQEKAKMIISSLSDRDLIDAGIVFMWQLCREVNFLTGELLIADIILRHCANDSFYRLHVVNTFIKAGRADAAREELIAIATRFGMDQHRGHIERFGTVLGCLEHLKELSEIKS